MNGIRPQLKHIQNLHNDTNTHHIKQPTGAYYMPGYVRKHHQIPKKDGKSDQICSKTNHTFSKLNKIEIESKSKTHKILRK